MAFFLKRCQAEQEVGHYSRNHSRCSRNCGFGYRCFSWHQLLDDLIHEYGVFLSCFDLKHKVVYTSTITNKLFIEVLGRDYKN